MECWNVFLALDHLLQYFAVARCNYWLHIDRCGFRGKSGVNLMHGPTKFQAGEGTAVREGQGPCWRSLMIRRRVSSNSAFVINPLLRSINIASIRLSNDVDSITDTVPHAATVEHAPLRGSFTSRSKQSDVEFDVQSNKTHIVIARWQAGISDLHMCDNQTVFASRFRA